MCTKLQICIFKTVGDNCPDKILSRRRIIKIITRHKNFHGKFSLCAEYLIRSEVNMYLKGVHRLFRGVYLKENSD